MFIQNLYKKFTVWVQKFFNSFIKLFNLNIYNFLNFFYPGHDVKLSDYIKDMLSNWNITLDRVLVFFARLCKKQNKRTNKNKILAFCIRCRYKIKLKLFYGKKSKKDKTRCPVVFG